MSTKKTRIPLEPGMIYHIYNRGNNYNPVFFIEQDYQLFLDKMKIFLHHHCSIFAFALLPNHYHLLLRVNDKSESPEFSLQFSKFILSYTNTINFRERRCGSLFLSCFRRIKVDNEDYLKRLVYYINHNPVKHKITAGFKNYKYSSYPGLISKYPTLLHRDEVISWFGDLAGFIQYHEHLHDDDLTRSLCMEDD